jgi:adenylate cyclase
MSVPDSGLVALADFGAALSEAAGMDAVVDVALESIDTLLGFRHVLLMVTDPSGDRLTTIASRGYEVVGVGSEVRIGEGVIGSVAKSRRPMRIGNLQRMLAYVRTVQQSTHPGEAPSTTIQLPGLSDARSQVAAPMVADGVLMGVIAAESDRAMAFDEPAQLVLTIAAQLVAGALERAEIVGRIDDAEPAPPIVQRGPHAAEVSTSPRQAGPPRRLRHYSNDGSTFIDDEYIIKGVAGRLLWKLASEHSSTGRAAYTNREVRLDTTLDMPSFKDNFESRLVLLKRRLEERDAPLRIHRTGRGRFDVVTSAPLTLERL